MVSLTISERDICLGAVPLSASLNVRDVNTLRLCVSRGTNTITLMSWLIGTVTYAGLLPTTESIAPRRIRTVFLPERPTRSVLFHCFPTIWLRVWRKLLRSAETGRLEIVAASPSAMETEF
jgi:hypothetical protein